MHAGTHHSLWLRWLRDGILITIAATGLLGLLVTYQAHREITAAGRGAVAIVDLKSAYADLYRANVAAKAGFAAHNTALLDGAGSQVMDDINAADQDLAGAAGYNAAGSLGARGIQFAGVLRANYNDEIVKAIADAARADSAQAGPLAQAEVGYAHDILYGEIPCQPPRVIPFCGYTRIGSVLAVLNSEQDAVVASLGSRWLGPRDVGLLQLAPLFAMLVLMAGASRVLRRGFRRVLSVRLVAAFVLVLGLAVLLLALNAHDRKVATQSVSPELTVNFPLKAGPGHKASQSAIDEAASSGLAYSPWVLATGLALAAGAGGLAYTAFRPRLEEYRYRP